jgi:hypothetical protein
MRKIFYSPLANYFSTVMQSSRILDKICPEVKEIYEKSPLPVSAGGFFISRLSQKRFYIIPG